MAQSQSAQTRRSLTSTNTESFAASRHWPARDRSSMLGPNSSRQCRQWESPSLLLLNEVLLLKPSMSKIQFQHHNSAASKYQMCDLLYGFTVKHGVVRPVRTTTSDHAIVGQGVGTPALLPKFPPLSLKNYSASSDLLSQYCRSAHNKTTPSTVLHIFCT